MSGRAVAPVRLAAQTFDGSAPLLCATMYTMECEPGIGCQRGLSEDVNIPTFLRLDFEKKQISGTDAGGNDRVTSIKNLEHTEGELVLQGVENGRGWSLVIAERTGKMVLTASGDTLGFVVFGACTAL